MSDDHVANFIVNLSANCAPNTMHDLYNYRSNEYCTLTALFIWMISLEKHEFIDSCQQMCFRIVIHVYLCESLILIRSETLHALNPLMEWNRIVINLNVFIFFPL